MRIAALAVPLAFSLLLVPGGVRAQAEAAPPPVPLRNVISANPFLLIAAWFNAEYERSVSATTTVGGRISTVSLGDDSDFEDGGDFGYTSGRIFLRYYPKAAFNSFYFGVDAGFTGVSDGDETHTVGGAGFELGYNWMLGQRRNFYISVGAGADRLFGGDLADEGISVVIPTIRIVNIGWAF
jgi:hypothetical protein